MRVAVDGRPLVRQATGVATCLRDTIKAICEYLPEWELYVINSKPIDLSISNSL